MLPELWWDGSGRMPHAVRDPGLYVVIEAEQPTTDRQLAEEAHPVAVLRAAHPQGALEEGVEGAGGSCTTQSLVAAAEFLYGTLQRRTSSTHLQAALLFGDVTPGHCSVQPHTVGHCGFPGARLATV